MGQQPLTIAGRRPSQREKAHPGGGAKDVEGKADPGKAGDAGGGDEPA